MVIKTDNISGTQIEVSVNTYGQFSISLSANGTTIAYGDMMEQVYQKARAYIAKRKVKVSIPFRTSVGEHGVATGIHSSNGSVLAKIDGVALQMNGRGNNSVVLKADTPEEDIARLIKITEIVRNLTAEEKRIEFRNSLNLKSAVDKAIEEAIAANEAAS